MGVAQAIEKTAFNDAVRVAVQGLEDLIHKFKGRDAVLVTYGGVQKGCARRDAKIVIVANGVRNNESKAFCNYSTLRVETKMVKCPPTSISHGTKKDTPIKK